METTSANPPGFLCQQYQATGRSGRTKGKTMLSNKSKNAIESDFFKALRKKMTLETRRNVLDNEIKAMQNQMDGLEAMLGYKVAHNVKIRQDEVDAVKEVGNDTADNS